MGYAIYVRVWGQHDGPDSSYTYVEVYGGRSFLEAFRAMRKAKRDGFKCICLEWRP